MCEEDYNGFGRKYIEINSLSGYIVLFSGNVKGEVNICYI